MGAQFAIIEPPEPSVLASQIDLTPEESILVRRGLAALRRGHQEIIEFGKVLTELKAAVSHGRFLRIVKERFGMDRDTSAMFMRLATYKPFMDVVTLLHVPRSPHTMDILRQLDDDQMQAAIDQGDVHPGLTVRGAAEVVRQYIAPAPYAVENRTRTSDTWGIPIEFSFRTQHVEYLTLLAERWETSISDAFRTLVDKKIAAAANEPARPPSKQITKHLTVSAKHLQFIDGMAGQTGLSRSDVARRLINEMLERDKSVDLPKVSGEFLRADLN
jgi:hypothetical protein